MAGVCPGFRRHAWWVPLVAGLLLLGVALPAFAGWRGGVRTGPLLGRTELADRPGTLSQAFVRRSLRERWQLEAAVGYGRLAGSDYAADIGLAELRLLFDPTVLLTIRGKPIINESWKPFVYSGVGGLRYDLSTLPRRRTGDARPIGWSTTVPMGVGMRYPLSDGGLLEFVLGYTYTFRDDVNGAILARGNDVLWSATLGLTLAVGWAPPPSAAGEGRTRTTTDRDGDGLTDWEETVTYVTNPVMADSDSDGLSDAEEVREYHTNPNWPDTDGGGVSDGEEVRAGRDPLDIEDDVVAGPEWPQMGKAGFPVIFFPQGEATLTRKARRDLADVAEKMERSPDLVLELRGYSDNDGRPEANLRLSRRYAERVKEMLVSQGVEMWRLSVVAFGGQNPIAPNETTEGRRQNRRVELVLIAP